MSIDVVEVNHRKLCFWVCDLKLAIDIILVGPGAGEYYLLEVITRIRGSAQRIRGLVFCVRLFVIIYVIAAFVDYFWP